MEVLLALTIGSLIVVSAVSATRGMSRAQVSVRQRADRVAEARRAMDAIVGALRNVRRDPTFEAPIVIGHRGVGVADSDRIDLQVIGNRPVRADGIESDQYEMAFFLEQRGKGMPALMCRRDHAFDEYPEEGGIVSVLAEGIVGLNFEYYFAGEWHQDWASTQPQPPQAVRVMLAAASPPDPTQKGAPEVLVLTSAIAIKVEAPQKPSPEQNKAAAPGGPAS